ncbi:MAG: hypothetical protein GY804_07950 [Alphaproteobacteria bacterium]|nr:hypothetical protein [Alphaproteobacteria bacterium]
MSTFAGDLKEATPDIIKNDAAKLANGISYAGGKLKEEISLVTPDFVKTNLAVAGDFISSTTTSAKEAVLATFSPENIKKAVTNGAHTLGVTAWPLTSTLAVASTSALVGQKREAKNH